MFQSQCTEKMTAVAPHNVRRLQLEQRSRTQSYVGRTTNVHFLRKWAFFIEFLPDPSTEQYDHCFIAMF